MNRTDSYMILFLNVLKINAERSRMSYYIHEDVNSSSHVGSVLLYYLHTPVKCPLGLSVWFLIRALDTTCLVCVDIFCMNILKRKQTFQIFINEVTFHYKY
jgi:hypothetical protein